MRLIVLALFIYLFNEEKMKKLSSHSLNNILIEKLNNNTETKKILKLIHINQDSDIRLSNNTLTKEEEVLQDKSNF
jgi:hypothetical protein